MKKSPAKAISKKVETPKSQKSLLKTASESSKKQSFSNSKISGSTKSVKKESTPKAQPKVAPKKPAPVETKPAPKKVLPKLATNTESTKPKQKVLDIDNDLVVKTKPQNKVLIDGAIPIVKKSSAIKVPSANSIKADDAVKVKVPATPNKTRYSDSELVEFKNLIDDKLEQSKSELKYLQEQIHQSADEDDSKFMGLEDGVGTNEKEELNRLAARQLKYISHLENALVRIKNKTYGICRVTGKLISKERLRAVPHATLSIEAKNNMA